MPNLELTLVGSGTLAKPLAALADELNVSQRIHFAGELDDAALVNEFARCDCLCLPSIERTEAFGLVLLEAMYFSKPTIVGNVEGSGMTWVCDDGVTGFHVEPKNETDLAAALQRLAADPELCHRLGVNGNDKFNRQFSMEQCALRMNALYLETIEAFTKTAAHLRHKS